MYNSIMTFDVTKEIYSMRLLEAEREWLIHTISDSNVSHVASITQWSRILRNNGLSEARPWLRSRAQNHRPIFD
jgi:hypothetical protein